MLLPDSGMAEHMWFKWCHTQPWKFGQDLLEFVGFEITPSNVRPYLKTYLRVIQDFPTPKRITYGLGW